MPKTPHNVVLYEAMKRYVSTASDLVTGRVAQRDSQREDDEEVLFFTRLSLTDELQHLPEYQICLETLLNDSVITSQTEVLTGTNSSMRERSQSAEGLMTRLLDLGMREGHGDFDAEYFDHEYPRFEEAYYCSDVVYEVIALLPGVRIARSLKLSDDLELTSMPIEELDPTLRRKNRRLSEHPVSDHVCVVRTECRLPKVVGDIHKPDHQARERDLVTQRAVHRRIERVINALRLSEIENAYSTVIIHRPSKWSFDQDRVFRGRFYPEFFFMSRLEEQWLAGFEEFWQSFESEAVRARSFLDIAIRRFGYAHERQNPEDRIIDLMIAAEALFFSDYNKDSYLGEIRYRLSMRAAFFLANEVESQKTVSRWMKTAYDLRSKLSHGGDAGNTKLPRREDGSEVTFEEFVGVIQAYVRLALVRAIHIANDPVAPRKLVEWDELMFRT